CSGSRAPPDRLKPALTAISALRRRFASEPPGGMPYPMAEKSPSPSRRFFLYGVIAVPISALIFAVATALRSTPTPKLNFDMKVQVSDQDVAARGTIYLEPDGFSYEGARLSFSGTVVGTDVTVKGRVTSEDRTVTRDFTTTGHLTGGRMSATLNGSGGRRMGSLKLELANP